MPKDMDRLPELETAACYQVIAPDLFYLQDNQRGYDPVVLEHLRDTCTYCPLKLQCLKYALNNERFGVWGGMTAGERASFLELVGRKDLGGYANIALHRHEVNAEHLTKIFQRIEVNPAELFD